MHLRIAFPTGDAGGGGPGTTDLVHSLHLQGQPLDRCELQTCCSGRVVCTQAEAEPLCLNGSPESDVRFFLLAVVTAALPALWCYLGG